MASYTKNKLSSFLFMIKHVFQFYYAPPITLTYKWFCTACFRNDNYVFISKICLKPSCNIPFFRMLYAHLWLTCCVAMTTLLCLPWNHVFVSGWTNLIMLIFCSSNPSFCPPNNPLVKPLPMSYKSLVFTQCWPLIHFLRGRNLCTRIKKCFQKRKPNS